MTSFPAPLAVRVGRNRIITKQLADLSFKKAAPGGYTSAQFQLTGEIGKHQLDIEGLKPVTISDTRTGKICWQGRLEDPGRSADGQNERWDVVAIGPSGEWQYHNRPVIYVDRVLDHWFQMDRVPGTGTDAGPGTLPASNTTPCLLAQFENGVVVGLNDRAVMGYDLIRQAGQTVGGFRATVKAGVGGPSWRYQSITRTDWGAGVANYDIACSTGDQLAQANTAPNGHNTLEWRLIWTGGAATVGQNNWGSWRDIWVRGTLRDRHGALMTALSYQAFGYVEANNVIEDLIGRFGLGVDPNNAWIDPGADFQFTQLAYPDGASAAQIMNDVMAVTPDYTWAIWENGRFRWEPWPSEVRYEVGVTDGFSSPQSSSEVYNACPVRYIDPATGQKVVTVVTSNVPALTAAGLTREAPIIDLSDELGSLENALQLGAQFLATHAYPTNGGNVTIARPIRDLVTGRRVLPHEIEPGNLIRVRGVEAYPDALNPTTDGATVFRLVGTDYRASEASVQCDLGSPAQSLDYLLAELAERRQRKE